MPRAAGGRAVAETRQCRPSLRGLAYWPPSARQNLARPEPLHPGVAYGDVLLEFPVLLAHRPPENDTALRGANDYNSVASGKKEPREVFTCICADIGLLLPSAASHAMWALLCFTPHALPA
jgi:hypothetical protein